MKEEKPLTELESLALIQEMIHKARNSFVDNGIGPLVWGILVTFCSLFLYAELMLHFRIGFDIFNLTFIAFLVQVYYAWRSSRFKRVKTHDMAITTAVWSTFAICMLITVHYNISRHASSVEIFLMLYGIPTYITGQVKKFMPMSIGGIICWVCSIIACYASLTTDLLLMAVSATAAWLIPGIILRRKYLKLKHV